MNPTQKKRSFLHLLTLSLVTSLALAIWDNSKPATIRRLKLVCGLMLALPGCTPDPESIVWTSAS